MTYAKAKKELKKLADGRHWSIRFSESADPIATGNPIHGGCSVYIANYGWFSHFTWEKVLGLLKDEIYPIELPKNQDPKMDIL